MHELIGALGYGIYEVLVVFNLKLSEYKVETSAMISMGVSQMDTS